ncbi:MAG TPA: hypothetical protein VGM37_06390 [Armatimonadota bacterium]|jgi:hypothetical protein
MTMRARERYLPAITAIVAVLSLATPGTARFVGQQLRDLIPGLNGFRRADLPGSAERLRVTALRLPNDPAAECAAAFTHRDHTKTAWSDRTGVLGVVAALEDVERRHPDSPCVVAADIAALAMRGNNRDEMVEIAALAARGERLEPGNAFFSAVRCGALMKLDDQSGALVALRRAAKGPRWDDHLGTVTDGTLRLIDAQGGPNGRALEQILVLQIPTDWGNAASLIVGGADAALDRAAVLDERGRISESVALRHDVMKMGSRMRTGSTSMFEAMRGSWLAVAAARRPGWASQAGEVSGSADYVNWLSANGQRAEAAYVTDQLRRREAVRFVVQSAISDHGVSEAVWLVSRSCFPDSFLLYCCGWALLCWLGLALARKGARPALVKLPLGFGLIWAVWLCACGILPFAGLAATTAALYMIVSDTIRSAPAGRRGSEGPRPEAVGRMMLCVFAIVVLALAPFAARVQRDRYAYARAAAHGEGAYVARQLNLPWPD